MKTAFALSYNAKLKSLNSPQFMAAVPLKLDRHLVYTIGLGAHYFNLKGVFTTDFPYRPLTHAPITGNLRTTQSTLHWLNKIAHNSTVELVLQDTNLLSVESHPFLLHGYNFFIVGSGIWNFVPKNDPPERNTVRAPTGGWTAIRFRVDNPGVWFMHCHLELHTSWRLKTAFVVEDGRSPNLSLLPPPKDLPLC